MSDKTIGKYEIVKTEYGIYCIMMKIFELRMYLKNAKDDLEKFIGVEIFEEDNEWSLSTGSTIKGEKMYKVKTFNLAEIKKTDIEIDLKIKKHWQKEYNKINN
jgi:hypothetical protein